MLEIIIEENNKLFWKVQTIILFLSCQNKLKEKRKETHKIPQYITTYYHVLIFVTGTWFMRVSKKQLPPIFHLIQISLNFTTTQLPINSLHLSQHSSSTFEQEQVFPPSKSCSPSSAANSTWYSTGPCHLHNGVLPFKEANRWKSDGVKSGLYGSSGNTVHPNIVMASNCTLVCVCARARARVCVCVCVACCLHGTATSVTFLLWEELPIVLTVYSSLYTNSTCHPKRL
jgi:hypothetical protein